MNKTLLIWLAIAQDECNSFVFTLLNSSKRRKLIGKTQVKWKLKWLNFHVLVLNHVRTRNVQKGWVTLGGYIYRAATSSSCRKNQVFHSSGKWSAWPSKGNSLLHREDKTHFPTPMSLQKHCNLPQCDPLATPQLAFYFFHPVASHRAWKHGSCCSSSYPGPLLKFPRIEYNTIQVGRGIGSCDQTKTWKTALTWDYCWRNWERLAF